MIAVCPMRIAERLVCSDGAAELEERDGVLDAQQADDLAHRPPCGREDEQPRRNADGGDGDQRSARRPRRARARPRRGTRRRTSASAMRPREEVRRDDVVALRARSAGGAPDRAASGSHERAQHHEVDDGDRVLERDLEAALAVGDRGDERALERETEEARSPRRRRRAERAGRSTNAMRMPVIRHLLSERWSRGARCRRRRARRRCTAGRLRSLRRAISDSTVPIATARRSVSTRLRDAATTARLALPTSGLSSVAISERPTVSLIAEPRLERRELGAAVIEHHDLVDHRELEVRRRIVDRHARRLDLHHDEERDEARQPHDREDAVGRAQREHRRERVLSGDEASGARDEE